jgi:integrase
VQDDVGSKVVAEVLRRAAHGKAPDELLFSGVTGGPIEEHFTDRRWAAAITAAAALGLRKRPRFHDLRHTHAEWLISAGVPLPVIQKRLGHESITTTVDVYGGLLDQAHEAADAAIQAALVHGRVPAPRPPHLATVDADNEVVLDVDDEARPEIDMPEVAYPS